MGLIVDIFVVRIETYEQIQGQFKLIEKTTRSINVSDYLNIPHISFPKPTTQPTKNKTAMNDFIFPSSGKNKLEIYFEYLGID